MEQQQAATGVDVIILSYAKTGRLRTLTEKCIESLLISEDIRKVFFEILVIESEKSTMPYHYRQTKTIYPNTAFGYNKFMNIGITATRNPYVCLCNNDLVFHDRWATEILNAFRTDKKIRSANPYSPTFRYPENIDQGGNVVIRSEQPAVNGVLTGWCIFAERSVFEQIGPLDERFTFWYADNDYGLTLDKHHIRHALVKSSRVTHLEAQSHDLLGDRKDELTVGQREIFEKKWYASKWGLYKRSVMNRLQTFIAKIG